jgi:hypothetical protein
MSFFDPYEIRARLIPAALIASPLLLPLLAFGLISVSTVTSTALTSVILVLVVYLFSHVVAFLGRRSEPALWKSWGGPPSVTLLSGEDKTFPVATKDAIRRAILDTYGIDLNAVDGDALKWREQATEAFRLIRQYLRQHDPKGLWSVQNAEYGAVRNLAASAWLCAVFSGLSAAACGTAAWIGGGLRAIALGITSVSIGVIVLLLRLAILRPIARSIAFRYAESAWLSFLNVSAGIVRTTKGGS